MGVTYRQALKRVHEAFSPQMLCGSRGEVAAIALARMLTGEIIFSHEVSNILARGETPNRVMTLIRNRLVIPVVTHYLGLATDRHGGRMSPVYCWYIRRNEALYFMSPDHRHGQERAYQQRIDAKAFREQARKAITYHNNRHDKEPDYVIPTHMVEDAAAPLPGIVDGLSGYCVDLQPAGLQEEIDTQLAELQKIAAPYEELARREKNRRRRIRRAAAARAGDPIAISG